jgi:hypothetical protein
VKGWLTYRNQAFNFNNGIRIDHLYASKNLAARCTDVLVDIKARREKSASDHAPVLARFALDRATIESGAPRLQRNGERYYFETAGNWVINQSVCKMPLLPPRQLAGRANTMTRAARDTVTLICPATSSGKARVR